MRDPRRIRRILTLLQRHWEQHADLRLGQMIMNLTQEIDPTSDLEDIARRVFSTEDDRVEELLRRKLGLLDRLAVEADETMDG